MHIPTPRLQIRCVRLILCALTLLAGRAKGADSSSQYYDIPAEAAAVAFQRFTAISGHDILFPAETARGIQTAPISGNFTPRDALDRMLTGTQLIAVEDESTGTFALHRTITTNEQTQSLSNETSASAGAQTVATASPVGSSSSKVNSLTDGDVIALNPFEVDTTADHGYTAANSLAGGRTSTPLTYTASAVTELSSQFLADIASTNFATADFWSVNYTPTPTVNNNGQQEKNVNYRNMGSTFVTRNYFLWYILSDSYNVDRYEEVRGPNGVIYGDGGAAGGATTFTKQANFGGQAVDTSAMVNSLGALRFTGDWNIPVNSRVALRLNVLEENGPSTYFDHTHLDQQGVDLAATVKLSSKDFLRFDGEIGAKSRSIYPIFIEDYGSLWDQATSYNGSTAIANASSHGVQAITAANGNIVVNGVLQNWTNYYTSLGTGGSVNLLPTGHPLIQLLHAPSLPKEGFNFQPPDILAHTRYYTWSGYYDHEFNHDVHFEGAYAVQRQIMDSNGDGSHNFFNTYTIDVNAVTPAGTPNPNFGQPYTDSEPEKVTMANLVTEVRGALNWHHDFGWIDESASVIGGSRMDRFFNFNSLYKLQSNGAIVYVRRYWNQAGQDEGDLTVPGAAYVPSTDADNRKGIDYGQLETTTQLFDKRLTLTLGGRYDKLYLGALANLTDITTRTNQNLTGRNAGAVYYFVPWLGVLGSYSETYAPPSSGNPLLTGQLPTASPSNDVDWGVKLNLFGGKISGSARYYDTVQRGILQAGNNVTQVNAIWNALNEPQNDLNAFRDTSDLKGTGYEIELTANPSENIRIMFNYAIPRVKNLNVEPELKDYVAENLGVWSAAAATNATVATNLNTITSRLNGLAVGAESVGTYKYTGNLLAAYSFTHGALKNLTVGGGVNLRGPAVVGSYPGAPFSYIYAPQYYLLSTFVSYQYSITKKLRARVQVNLTNLLDNRQLIATGVANITTPGYLPAGVGTTFMSNYYIPDPRQATLTTTIDF